MMSLPIQLPIADWRFAMEAAGKHSAEFEINNRKLAIGNWQ